MAKIVDASNFTRQESSSSSIISHSYSLQNKKTNSFATSSIASQPIKPSLFQFELRNHKLRKQIESCHYKIISTFKQKKKELTRLENVADQQKMKKKQMENRMIDCYRKMSNTKLRPSCQENLLLKTGHHFQKHFRISTDSQTENNAYQLYVGNSDGENVCANPWGSNRRNYRDVYLGNISNLEELRSSLSYSRAKFNRKPIKMSREIGRKYYPYFDQLPQQENGVKGIFF